MDSPLAARALELAHEGDHDLHGVESDRVIQRDAHAADRTMAGRADQPGGRRLFREFLLDGFIASSYTEDYVHARARSLLDWAGVVAAGVDRVVEQLGFGFVALFDRGDATFGAHPLHHQAQ